MWPLAAPCVATRMSISPSVIAAISARAASGPATVSDENTASRAAGKSSRASSSTRSTPGPTETRLSLAPQWGQRCGFSIEKPVRWQTRRPE